MAKKKVDHVKANAKRQIASDKKVVAHANRFIKELGKVKTDTTKGRQINIKFWGPVIHATAAGKDAALKRIAKHEKTLNPKPKKKPGKPRKSV